MLRRRDRMRVFLEVAFLVVAVGLLALTQVVFGQVGMNPACETAKQLRNMWGVIKVIVTAVIVVSLLLGAGFSFIEKRGGWGLVLVFASFILGVAVWTALNAAGTEINQYANSCGQ